MKILVISLAGIGDCLIASPLIKELRKNFPNAKIDVFVMWNSAKILLEKNPFIDKIYQLNMFEKGHFKSLNFCLKLRRVKYDITINTHPQSKIQYRIVSKIINGRKRLSHLYGRRNLIDKFLVNKIIKQRYDISNIDNNLNLLKILGISRIVRGKNYEIFLSEENKKNSQEFIKKNKLRNKIIGFHVGSGTTKNIKLRRWALKNYIELIKRILNENKKINILLFGGPEEKFENEKIIETIKDKRIFLVETKNIRESAGIIEKCHLFISVDTLLMHIASAMKVKNQIIIGGPTYGKTVEPKTNPIVIQSDLKCVPCYKYDGKGIICVQREKMKCLKQITPDKVYDVVKEVIKNE